MSQKDLDVNKELFQQTSSWDATEIYNDYTLSLDQKNYYLQNTKEYWDYRKTIPYEVGLNERVKNFKKMMSDPMTFALFKDGAEQLKQINKEMDQAELDNANIFTKWKYSFDKSRISQDAMDAYADWADAKHDRQYLKAQEAYDKYQRLQTKLEENYSSNVDKEGNPLRYGFLSSADILASQANWQNIGAMAVGAGVGVATAGMSTVAQFLLGGAAAGVAGFNRVRDVEMGGALQEIIQQHPDIDFDRAYVMANQTGNLNALIESSSYFLGAGRMGLSGVKTILKPFIKSGADNVVKTALKSPVFAKRLFNFMKNVSLDVLGETTEELIQNDVEKMAQDYIDNNQDASYLQMLYDATKRDAYGLMRAFTTPYEELSEEDQERLETAKSVSLGTLFLGGIGAGSRAAAYKVASQIESAKKDAKTQDNLIELTSELRSKLSNLDNGKMVKAVGDAMGKDNIITVSPEIFKKISEVREKLDDNGKRIVDEIVSTSKELPDGKYEIDRYAYGDMVMNSQELFQTIKNDVRFSADGLSNAEIKEVLKTLVKDSEVFAQHSEAKDMMNNMTKLLKSSAGYDDIQAKAQSFLYVQMMAQLANANGISLQQVAENLRLNIIDERNKINNQDLNKYKNVKKGLLSQKLEGEKVYTEDIDLRNVELSEGFDLSSVEGQKFSPEASNGILLYRTKDGKLLSLEGDKKVAIARNLQDPAMTKAIIFDESNTSFEKAQEAAKNIQNKRKKDMAIKAAGEELEKYRNAMKPKSAKRKFKSLSEFIASKEVGGIKDVDGWLSRGVDKKGNKIVNNTSGISYEDAMEKAFDAGYFPNISDVKQEMTVGDFIDAVLEDYNADDQFKTYSQNDYDEVSEFFKSDFDRVWDEAGLDLENDTPETAYEKLKQVDGWEEWVTRTMEDAPKDLFQKIVGEAKAGSLTKTDNGYVMKFMEATNPTTFMHEMNHVFVLEMKRLFDENKLDDYWKDTFKNAVEWAGGKIENGKVVLSRNGYEKLADGFTKYLKNGQAPVSALDRLFAYFARLFEAVYKALRLDNSIRLNKKVTDFYDKMLLTREQIRQRDLENRVTLFEKPKDISLKEWNDFLAETEKIIGVRQSMFEKAVDNRMKYVADVRYKQHRAEVTAQAMNELMENPIYQIQQKVLAEKINPETLPEGVEIPPAYLDKNGISYQELLNDVKAEQGEDYINQIPQILSSPNLETALTKKVDLRMNEWVNEKPEFKNTDFDILTKDYEAFKHLCRQYCLLNKIPDVAKFTRMLAEETQRMIARMPLSEISNYDKQTRIYTNLSLQVAVDDNKKRAEFTKRLARQMLVVYNSKNIRDKINKFSDKYKRYTNDYDPKKNKNVDGQVWDIMNAFLYNNKYTQKKPRNTANLLDRVKGYLSSYEGGYSVLKELEASEVLKSTTAQKEDDFIKMPYENFVDLYNVMDIIEASAKELNKVKVLQENVELDNVVNDVVNHIVNVRKMKPMDKKETMWLKGRLLSTTLKNWLPEKVYNEVFLPLANAIAQKDNLHHQMNNELYRLFEGHEELFKRNFNVMIDGKQYNFDANSMLALVLNCGTNENVKALTNYLKNRNIPVSDLNVILSQLPKEMLEIANSVWGWFDKRKQQIVDKTKELLNGYELELVKEQPRDISLANGETFHLNGGYFPLSIFREDTQEYLEEADKEKISVNTFPIASFMRNRTLMDREKATYELKALNLNPLLSYVYKQASILTIAKPYNDFSKIMKNKMVREALGQGRNEYIDGWLKNIIAPEKGNEFLVKVNSFASFALLSAKVTSAFVQTLGSVVGFATVGPTYMGKSLINLLTHPKQFLEPAKALTEKSSGMQSRYADFEKNIEDILLGKSPKLKGLKQKTDKFLMMAVEYGDAIASNIIWQAEYYKQLDITNDDTLAKMKADDMVRSTQGDASVISRVEFLRGSNRFSSRFMSYYFAMYSNLMQRLENPDKIQAIKQTAALIGTIMVAGVAEEYIKSALKGEDKDWDEILLAGGESVANTFMPVGGLGGVFYNTAFGRRGFSADVLQKYAGTFGESVNKLVKGDINGAIPAILSIRSLQLGKIYDRVVNKGDNFIEALF